MIARRSLLLAVPGLALAGAPGRPAFALDANGAKTFVRSLANDAIALIARKDVPGPERNTRFREMLNRGFDVEGIGRFVLGRYWREATDAERAEYLALFEDLILSTYATRFAEYSGETLTVLDARPEDGMVLVTSQIDRPTGPPIRLDWRLNETGGSYKIFDVIVEGVSMSVTQRSEFSSVIQRGGGKVSSLIAALRDKTRGMR